MQGKKRGQAVVEHLPAPDHQPLLESESMATDTVTTLHADKVWTPCLQHLNSTVKPVKLLELGENERGKFARIEFEDESSRPLYLLTMEDAWHPVFESLDWDSRWKIRDHYNTCEPEQMPDGKVKTREYVSFHSMVKTKRGAALEWRYFDVPPESYYDGMVRGIMAGKEFLEVLRLKSGPDMRLSLMVEELAAAHKEPRVFGSKKKTRSSTLESFLSVLDAALSFAAKNANFSNMIEARIKDARASDARNIKDEAREKEELVERLRKGREAKRKASQELVAT